jgi:hypothetical protein
MRRDEAAAGENRAPTVENEGIVKWDHPPEVEDQAGTGEDVFSTGKNGEGVGEMLPEARENE